MFFSLSLHWQHQPFRQSIGFQWAVRETLTAHRSFYTILLTGTAFMQAKLSQAQSCSGAPTGSETVVAREAGIIPISKASSRI